MEMPKTFYPHEKKLFAPSLCDLLNPIHAIPGGIPLLLPRGNKPLELSFEQQLNALVYFHLEEHTSGCHLIQSIDEDDFAREFVSGSKGIKKSTSLKPSIPEGLNSFNTSMSIFKLRHLLFYLLHILTWEILLPSMAP
jgi:hypothetical protein